MAFTQPAFALPFVVSGTITLTFNDASTHVATIGTSSIVRFNDRSGATGTDAVAYTVLALDTSDGGGTWVAAAVPGDFLGRVKFTRTPSDGKLLSVIAFSGGLTGKMFGFTSNTPSVADGQIIADVATGTWQLQYLWIPQPASQILQGESEKTSVDAVVATSSPDGTTTRDFYGGVDRRRIVIYSIPAAGIWQTYADAASFSTINGNTAGDQNCAFDEFRKLWRTDLPTVDTAKLYCRYYIDASSTDHVQLDPGQDDPWIGDLSTALEVESRSPYRFALTLAAFEVA